MTKTQNLGRGDLRERMSVLEENGEEHFRFDGAMMYEIATEKLSQWLLGGNLEELEPEANFIVLAGNRHGYWVINHQKTDPDPEMLERIIGKRERHKKPEWQLIVLAREVEIYNLDRDAGFAAPIAKFHSRLVHDTGAVLELTHLDASAEETVGLLRLIPAVRLAPKPRDRYTRMLLEKAPAPRTSSKEEKKTKAEDTSVRVRSGDPELARIFAKFENRWV